MATYLAGMDNSINMELQSELSSSETFLWSGKPQRRVIFHASDWAAIPFSLMWGGFAIFWELGASGLLSGRNASPGAPDFFMLWGIPFVLIGQYMIWGRFLRTAWKKGRTCYAVTNKRVIVLCMGASRKVMSGDLVNLDSISLATRPDGVRTLEFSPLLVGAAPNWLSNRQRNRISFDIDLARLAFIDIADARAVYQLIRTQREKLQAPAF